MGTEDVVARDAERHRPCLNHTSPWVETRCPACGMTRHRSRATQMLVTAMSATSPMTLLVLVA
jgi:hypothetical protein